MTSSGNPGEVNTQFLMLPWSPESPWKQRKESQNHTKSQKDTPPRQQPKTQDCGHDASINCGTLLFTPIHAATPSEIGLWLFLAKQEDLTEEMLWTYKISY